ncbi:unnamed protein product [Ectocarpus sp. CCAP 1310/34]|nr:unnamed protein product [Ectocarpus sp. CCAP 1310/34]
MALVNRSMEHAPRTSDIEFFSSLHGRQKRLQRGLNKRDLQAAVKHGTRREGYSDPKTGKPRWMYTLGNVVYITDETSTREITSYFIDKPVVQIPHAPLTPEDLFDQERAKQELARNPDLCTSHTVIVVDHSASMGTPDVVDHENRVKGCFGMLALNFVAGQLVSKNASSTDVVSVLLMHDSVDVLFEREPMSRVLYGRFVGMHDKVRPRSHGNFMPSLIMAEQLLREDANQPGTALSLMFLSDGKPSDNATGVLRGNNMATSVAISDRVSLMAATFGDRLSVDTLGFANPGQNFSVLQSMAKAARRGGAKGQFSRPELSSAGLASAIASAVSSLTDTKSHLSSTLMGATPGARGARRGLSPIRELQKESADCEGVEGWKVYVRGVTRLEYSPEFSHGIERSRWKPRRLVSPYADGIAIRRVPFEEGAEKVVYKMRGICGHKAGEPFVAKFSKRQQGHSNQDATHFDESADKAARALAEASKLANLFNAAVQEEVPSIYDVYDDPNGFVDQRAWGIKFLRCSMYKFTDDSAGGNRDSRLNKRILAEKWLNPSAYVKWNGNNGYVFHGRGHASVHQPSAGTAADGATSYARADRLMAGGTQLSIGGGGACAFAAGGGASAVDYGDGAEEYLRGGGGWAGGGSGGGSGSGGDRRSRKRGREEVFVGFAPRPTDYLQAFSHFSFARSGHKRLVCDLQGVECPGLPDNPFCAGVYQLTDPVIHSNSQIARQQMFGRTDLGKKGMHKFFRTHVCNDVCRLLKLPGSRSPQAEAAEEAANANAGAREWGGRGAKSRRMYNP